MNLGYVFQETVKISCILQICQVQGRVNFLSVEIDEKYQSSRLRLIFRGSFDFFSSKLTTYGNGNYIMLNRMNIFNVI